MKVLIAYYSSSGKTEKMAQYIAEGIRIAGHEAIMKKLEDLKAGDLAGYDGYIFGSPTFSLDLPEPVKIFLSGVKKATLSGKMGGAFGAYSHDVGYKHDNHAPAIIFSTLQKDFGVKPFELGAMTLQEDMIETGDGLKTCHDYGRVFGQSLGGRQ